MAVKYTKKFKDHIKHLVETVFPKINHNEFKWYLVFEEEDVDNGGDGVTMAQCYPYTAYLQYPIHIYPALFEEFRKKEYMYVAEVVVHEVCHLFSGPLVSAALKYIPEEHVDSFREIEERQTQRLAAAIFELLPTGWWVPNDKIKKVKENV